MRILTPMKMAIFTVCWLLLAQGCGSGASTQVGSESTFDIEESGDVVISVTDAEGDFVSYTVDVVSLVMERNNGDTVETLPLNTRVDFNELTQLSELFAIARVPVGSYTRIVMRLDYSNADILIEGADGSAEVVQLVDEAGNTLQLLDVEVLLEEKDAIRVVPNLVCWLALDFDLNASNTIDLQTIPATVTVSPYLVAMPEFEPHRAHRLRGLLDAVDQIESSITIAVRPFTHRTGEFGSFTFNTIDATLFEINGEAYEGAEGLRVLAELSQGTPLIAQGEVNESTLIANTVLAGDSVPWTDSDTLRGVVTKREGNILSLYAAHIEFRDGRRSFRGAYTVELGDNTVVTALGADRAQLSIQSISIGQGIVVSGALRDDKVMDASEGRVRMLVSRLAGRVLESQPLVVELRSISHVNPARLDFSGTGGIASEDSDPEFYEIDTSRMMLDSFEHGEAVGVRGYVNDFGMAPDDFNALGVRDLKSDMRAAMLKVLWADAGTALPFSNITPDRIDLDLSVARIILELPGHRKISPEQLALVPALKQGALYAISIRGSDRVSLYRDFSDLVEALVGHLDSGDILHHVNAKGGYNSSSEVLNAWRIRFVFDQVSK